jgi:nicotinamidase-related amidase
VPTGDNAHGYPIERPQERPQRPAHPEESVVVLIDHPPLQFANLHSHEPTMIENNVTALAKTAKIFGVPTILTTVLEDRGGKLITGLRTFSLIESRSTAPSLTPGRMRALSTR